MAAEAAPSTVHRIAAGKSKYRPEIDGLRALAVVAVIINHVNKDLLPSGYLGVDIFFVISGYVITASLADRQSKNFLEFLTGFYERRVKRLVPALVVFVLITSVLISLFNPDPGVALRTASASLFGFSNLYLFKQSTDYFAPSTELNPFTHTWSLGVEEQFYLLFPFLIWFSGFGRQSPKGARNLFFWIGGLTLASLFGFIFLYRVNQPAAYFLMPPRFWEMATGCLIFLGFQKRARMEQILERVPPLLVLAAMVGVMLLPLSAAVPATLAMVVLSAILLACLKEGTYAHQLFTRKNVVFIGLISYSLYLWHWTVLSISRWTIGIHWWSVPLQFLAMLALAVLSNTLIETPLRKASWSVRPVVTIAYGVILSLLGAIAIYASIDFSRIFYLGSRENRWPGISSVNCFSGRQYSKADLLARCTLRPKSRGLATVIAIGDSQTGHLLPLLNRLHAETGVGVMFYTQADINFPSIRESRSNYAKTVQEFDDRYQRHLDTYAAFIDSAKAGDILLISSRFEKRWGKSPETNSNGELPVYVDPMNRRYPAGSAYGAWQRTFRSWMNRAEQKGVRVLLFTSFPKIQANIPRCVNDPQWFNDFPWCANRNQGFPRKEIAANAEPVNAFFKGLASASSSVYLFDQFNVLCSSEKDQCEPRYTSDGIHLSRLGEDDLYDSLKLYLSENRLVRK